MTKLRPAGFEVPYPAWGPVRPYALEYAQAQIAIQTESGSTAATTLFGHLSSLLAAAPGLLHFERVRHVDAQGAANHIAVSYWTSAAALREWLGHGSVLRDFADGVADGSAGVWYEWLAVPGSHYETQGSTPDADWGLARHCSTDVEPDHGYWGAMRDRIAAAEDGGLRGCLGELRRQPRRSVGRWRIELPADLCLIRTVQGYSQASPDERASYEADLRPEYERGVRYLADHPVESRCLSARLVSDDDPGPGRPDTETIAWFASLADLERWVHHHPTHAAIFAAGQAHSMRFAGEMRLLLGHEVAVTVAGAAEALYVNCHPETGLLPFLPAVPA